MGIWTPGPGATAGDDIFTGDTSNETASGLAGHDQLSGGDGADNLDGGDGNDTLSGEGGNSDVLAGGAGDDSLDGGAGTGDTAQYNAATSGVTVSLAIGAAQAVGGGMGSDTLANIENLWGGSYNDSLTGDAQGNYFDGFAGNDTIVAGAGGDALRGNLGDDRLDGGTGIDTALYFGATSGVTVILTTGSPQAVGGGFGNDTLLNIENVDGGDYGDTLAGDNNANTLRGFIGDDSLNGGAGDDSLTGGVGNDTLDGNNGTNMASYFQATGGVDVSLAISGPQAVGGGEGTDTLLNIQWLSGSGSFGDTLTGDTGANVLIGNGGNDSLSGGDGNDYFIAGTGNDTMDGGNGSNTASYQLAASGVIVSITAGPQAVGGGEGTDVLTNIQHLVGSSFNDTLNGDGGSNYLTGAAGGDSLSGGNGDDTVDAGIGNDTIDGGSGFDFAYYVGMTAGIVVDLSGGGPYTPSTEAGTDTYISIEGVVGGQGNDSLASGGANNHLYGYLGSDTLSGGGGDDTVSGAQGNDTVDGGSGTDQSIFFTNRADAQVQSYLSGGIWYTRVIDQVHAAGDDLLTGVETLVFTFDDADDLLGVHLSFHNAGIQQNHLATMDGSRFDDVLIRYANGNHIAFIDMFGQAAGTQGLLVGMTQALPTGWLAVASGDLDGDGRAEAIVQGPSGGLYFVNTATGSAVWGTISANLPSEWQVVGLGDMTLDGTLDLVIRSSVSGNLMYAEMNGTTFSGWGNVVNMGTGWRGVGVGDYDRDGDSDVLVQETATGTTYFVQMQGGAFSGWGLVTGGPGSQWVAKETADLNGDGYFDVVFQNNGTGQIWAVNMAGGVNAGWITLTTALGWNVAGSGDYDNDGYADILVQSPSSGDLYYINVDNGAMVGWGNVKNGLGTDWIAV